MGLAPPIAEEASLSDAIAKIRRDAAFVDIVVIDYGSFDSTAVIAERARAFVINLLHNLGIGGAMQTGYISAREMDGANRQVQKTAPHR